MVFNKRCWDNLISTGKRMNLDLYLTPYAKVNSKWIEDLNLRAKTVRLLKGKIGVNFCDLGNGFLDMTPKAQETEKK